MSHAPRPIITNDIVRAAVAKMATQEGWTTDDVDDIVRVYSPHDDGYTLAKKLESRCCWPIDTSVVETLDCIDPHVDEELERAVKEWAQAHNIRPPYPVGTRIRQGVITGISTHYAARYEVRADNLPDHARRLIKFEDARPA